MRFFMIEKKEQKWSLKQSVKSEQVRSLSDRIIKHGKTFEMSDMIKFYNKTRLITKEQIVF